MSRRRQAWLAVAAALVLAAIAVLLIFNSAWFRDHVRQRIVETIQDSTGGRVEIAAFKFDWKQMRAELHGVVLHGTEPPGKPPLLSADSIALGLKVNSWWKRDVDVRYLEVVAPHVYLIVQPDGRTNLPQPKTPAVHGNTMETVLKLAVGRFSVLRGEFEVASRGSTPFEAKGHDLELALAFDPSGPRYRGQISIQPLDLEMPGFAPAPVTARVSLALERNRVSIESARFLTGDSTIDLSGSIEDLAAPHGSFRYHAKLSNADAERALRTRLLDRATVESSGNAIWRGGGDYQALGDVHVYGAYYQDSTIHLRNCRVAGALDLNPKGLALSRMGVSCPAALSRGEQIVQGTVALGTLRGNDIALRGIDVALIGGGFRGQAEIGGLHLFHIKGEFTGLAARRAVALYSPEPLPWDALMSGQMEAQGWIGRYGHITSSLSIAPAPASAPVYGQAAGGYDSVTGILDFGHSSLSLPSSNLEFSGAIGRELRVHAETRDLNDVLPAFGENATEFPVKLAGTAVFDGAVHGALDRPLIAGHVVAGPFAWEGQGFDSLLADVTVSPDHVRVEHAVVMHHAARLEATAQAALEDWKVVDSGQIFGDAAVTGAPLVDLATLASSAPLPVTGTLSAGAHITGTFDNPLAEGDVTVIHGSYQDEPFDRFQAHVRYSNRALELASGIVTAGKNQVKLAAAYRHAPDTLRSGALQFQLEVNALPVAEVRTFAAARPGATGIATILAHGVVQLTAPEHGPTSFHIEDLHADISAANMQLGTDRFGDARLKADSVGQTLNAHLDSDFAGSSIHGDGQWKLEGNYPGSATIKFTKLDFEQLRNWLVLDESTPALVGSAEGDLTIQGDALDPAHLKAALRIPQMAIAPAADAGLGESAALKNEGPIVAVLENSVVTIQSFRMVGKNTDLQVTGRYLFTQKSPFDLRAEGRVDLGVVHELNPDFVASGIVMAQATLRGTADTPQVNGRVEFQHAAFNIADVPNGISNANGVILFSGGRASIQSFEGITGGGTIGLSGFATYSGGEAVFRLRAQARQVRVRYPEGVSTIADATLNLTGTSERSMLSGTVTILRSGFNTQSDVSSIVAQSAEPVQTPSVRRGFLGGLNFDIQIATSPNVQVQTTLTQGLQVEANLHLRGTASNPALLGRVNVTQGQVQFFGTSYSVTQGSISFFNPLAVDPILNVDLETKARGINITLNISGPLNKLSLTPRSDPPLEFNEIVALLATGRAPTSDPALLSQQATTPGSWQGAGASALLGQAIASPVTGRLQRFFGVSRLRIDPTLPGLEYNPQARLTLEQQITPDITFTYITDVTSSNPQVISVEWAFTRHWSAVAQREENGIFGVDFFFKKRF